mgnify:CR=1 FL=1|jgi:hypothetical protein
MHILQVNITSKTRITCILFFHVIVVLCIYKLCQNIVFQISLFLGNGKCADSRNHNKRNEAQLCHTNYPTREDNIERTKKINVKDVK